jgi:CheY-like chemotaxis protein
MKNKNHSDRGARAGRPRWMIVDDNEDVLSLMCEIMAHVRDAEIVCFNSPQSALAAFEAAPESFQLVITDFEMPGMNGVELCHRLRAISPATIILLMTGSGMIGEASAAHEGFCGLLRKPFPFETLQRVLESAGVFGNHKSEGKDIFSAALTSA